VLAISKPNGENTLFECIPTGFADLDKIIRGFPLGELIVLGARPAMGKTAFLVSVMANTIPSNVPIAYFSVENSAQQIMLRLLSQYMEIQLLDIVGGDMSPEEVEKLATKTKALEDAKIYIEDTSFSIDDIITQVDYLVQARGVKLVLIDYLQMIKVNSRRENSREADVARVCRELKGLARKYKIAIVVNSQLSRAVETRGGDKKPQLSDLRESGAIEQDADKVLFLHRPEYYNITEDENGNSTNGVADIIIAKNRDGAIDSVKLNYVARCTKFKDLADTLENRKHYGSEYFLEIRKDEFKGHVTEVIKGLKHNDIIEDHPF